MGYLASTQDFNTLSIADLLAARENFHLHLMNKPNVVGTAIGRYRIRKSDPWPSHDHAEVVRKTHPERTLQNSEVRPYSWPAILVFVDQWKQLDDFQFPDQAVPRAVYMPDGKRVPICVIKADKCLGQPEVVGTPVFPSNLIGGGYPVLVDVQGREHVASIGCLVTDGHRVYALTNRHVCGDRGETIDSILGGLRTAVGTTSDYAETRVPFEEVYPGWPGSNVYVNLDVGLVDVDDVTHWTTQVYGVGEIGPLADVSMANLTLRLIGCPVRAHGAAGGDMRGEVCAMFYRFKSTGGFEYVCDLLIGPRQNLALGTRPGDSGTLWMIDSDDDATENLACLALQWGGQTFDGGSVGQSTFALATFVSTICNRFNVDLLRDWNSGNPDYWGAVGHYGIAAIAMAAIQDANLKKLMEANLERISYDLSKIDKNAMKGLSLRDYVPLADVPDMVWKVGPYKRGGMKSAEHPNHFADMDRELTQPIAEGKTLLEICKDPKNVAVDVWRRYYDAVKQQFPEEEESRGLLPFRCWQIYQEMVQFVKDDEVEKFVCAAGILSHYVGDSCQPLHISYLFNGDPDRPIKAIKKDPKTHEKKEGVQADGTGVHSAYEDDMVNNNVATLFPKVQELVDAAPWPTLVEGGQACAVAVVGLMESTFDKITPMDIVNAFIAVEDQKPAARAAALWEQFGTATAEVMARGSLCLASLWDSAWAEGGKTKIKSLMAIDEKKLAKLYQDPDFLPSMTLNQIGNVLK